MIEKIYTLDGRELLAIWIRSHNADFEEGTEFFTPRGLELQAGLIRRKAGAEIPAHRHLEQVRRIGKTNEVLLICKGSLLFTLYDPDGAFAYSGCADPGDILILVQGGHGFKALSDVEMIEVKQGPYNAEFDKSVGFELKKGE